jgi:UDP-N-acetylglucosamine 2-epimerase (non-hydrolysing)
VSSAVRPTRVQFIFGTRPEAIKLCPVICHMRERPAEFEVRVCVTAQHRLLLDQVLGVFDVVPDRDLDLMRPGQSLFQSSAATLGALEGVFEEERPDMVLVQGDTTTTFCGALAAFYAGVPVGHVEAGLRTGNFAHPFPEEMNRVLTTRLTTLHFAPTEWAASNLLREGVSETSVAVTGNPGIDAVLQVCDFLTTGRLTPSSWDWLDPRRRLILVTAHRRESFGAGIESLCEALMVLAQRPDVQIIYPVHPNPHVREPVHRLLGSVRSIRLLEPLAYVPFIDLMRRCTLLLTDSGGIQEEAPALGKPVLILRNTTERPEAIEAGTAMLTGLDPATILKETTLLLDSEAAYQARSTVHNPFGDGHAARRISDLISSFQSKKK